MDFDVAAVTDWLRLTVPGDVALLTPICAAVVSFIDSLPDVPRSAPPADLGTLGDWAPQTELAALMLAGRLYRRRNSPAGIEAFTDTGAAYVSRTDPDVARMLRIDGYARPQVG